MEGIKESYHLWWKQHAHSFITGRKLQQQNCWLICTLDPTPVIYYVCTLTPFFFFLFFLTHFSSMVFLLDIQSLHNIKLLLYRLCQLEGAQWCEAPPATIEWGSGGPSQQVIELNFLNFCKNDPGMKFFAKIFLKSGCFVAFYSYFLFFRSSYLALLAPLNWLEIPE